MSDRQAIGFVADAQIPPSPPPATSTGKVGWLRENLFSGPINSILTLASVALILWIVSLMAGIADVVIGLLPSNLLVIGAAWGLVEMIVAAIAGAWVYKEA